MVLQPSWSIILDLYLTWQSGIFEESYVQKLLGAKSKKPAPQGAFGFDATVLHLKKT